MNTMDALGTDSAERWGYRTLMGQNRRQIAVEPPTPAGQQPYGGQGVAPSNGIQAPPTGADASTTAVPPPAPPGTLDQWGRPPGHRDYGKPPVTSPDNHGPWQGGIGAGPGENQGRPAPPPPTPAGQQATYGTDPITTMGSGRGGTYAYTGFDFDQNDQNRLIGKSAKYTFADATRQAQDAGAGDVWKTKEGAQYFAEKYLKSKLEAAGVEVLDIKGDKMFLRDHEDRKAGRPGQWVDFVVNAGGANPELAWQPDGVNTGEVKHPSRSDAGTDPYAPPPAPDAPPPDGSEGAPRDVYGTRALLARERKRLSLADLVQG